MLEKNESRPVVLANPTIFFLVLFKLSYGAYTAFKNYLLQYRVDGMAALPFLLGAPIGGNHISLTQRELANLEDDILEGMAKREA